MCFRINGECLRQNTGKDIHEVADKVLQLLKERNVISVDMTCDFCSKPCINDWCESSYEHKKTE